MFPFGGSKEILYYHIIPIDNVEGKRINAGTLIGKVQRRPNKLSETNHAILLHASRLYDMKKYRDAFELLLTVGKAESENPFYLELLARAAFWVEKPEYKISSFNTYKKLIDIVDSSNEDPAHVLLIDLWFIDAYFKLGILALDFKDYGESVRQLSKVLIYGFGKKDRSLEMVMSYLTEAYYYLEEAIPNGYFYALTKKLFPRNTYVDCFRVEDGLTSSDL